MNDDLTEQENMFAVLLLQGKSGLDAFRLAFPDKSNWAPSAIYPAASRLRNSDKIQARMAELSKTVIERGVLRLEEYIALHTGLALRAEAAGNYGAAALSLKTAGQASGLHKDTDAQTDKRSPDELKKQLASLRKQAEEEGVLPGKWIH
jgi:hypothetical protein